MFTGRVKSNVCVCVGGGGGGGGGGAWRYSEERGRRVASNHRKSFLYHSKISILRLVITDRRLLQNTNKYVLDRWSILSSISSLVRAHLARRLGD